jgi:hypothetical protein
MLHRSVICFVVLVPLQLVAVHFVVCVRFIYLPFVDLVEPFVLRHYGRGDGSLGPVVLWGTLVGSFVYAAVLAFFATLLTTKAPSTRQPHA